MHRLQDNVTSSYVQASAALHPRDGRRRVVAYVESYDDVFFWRTVLARYESETLAFQVMLPTHDGRLGRGKKAALMAMLAQGVGPGMIACVDADYDYLMQGATSTSTAMLHSPYILHTYAYAIENMQCWAPSLRELAVAITLNDHDIFSFTRFLARFSAAIHPLFVWSVWHYRTGRHASFSITDFLQVIDVGTVHPQHADEALERLAHKVVIRLRRLERDNPRSSAGVAACRESLAKLGVTPETTYMYIQGHHLMDRVVVPLLSRVCTALVREREGEIGRESLHATQRRNELSCYQNSVGDVAVMLRKNLGYVMSPQYQHICRDVEAMLGRADGHEDQPPGPER